MSEKFAALKRKIARTANKHVSRHTVEPVPEERYQPFPLNDMQRAYWLGRNSDMEGGSIGMQCFMEFAVPDFDSERFNTALNLLIKRHDMLRAVVLPDGTQQVLEHTAPVTVKIENIADRSAEDQKLRLEEIATDMWRHVNDLTRWPQNDFRFSATDADGRGILHMKLDMWCFDGRSVQIFMEDLAALYRDPAKALRPFELSFCDYIRAVREEEQSEKFQRDLAYWKERLKTLPPPPGLPQAPATAEAQGSSAHVDVFTSREHGLSVATTASILGLCRKYGISTASCIASVYSDILSLWSGQNRFTINFPRFNRNLDWHPDVNHMIGEFASFSLLEVDRGHGTTFLERTRALQERIWDDLEHSGISGIRVLRERIIETGQPEIQAMPIVFTAMPERRGEMGELEDSLTVFGRNITSKGATPQVWLDCQYYLFNEALQVKWDSRDHVFPPGMIDDMFAEFVRVLDLLADETLWEETILARAPEKQLSRREKQNNLPQSLEGGNVFRLFSERVQRQSHSPAVIATDRSLTYGELHDLALTISGFLTSFGKPQSRSVAPTAAILLERGWRQVASVMGVIASGMAYIPLDPATPLERLRMILSAADPFAVITEPSLAQLCRDAGGNAVLFDAVSAHEATSSVPAMNDLPEEAPAYLIFTSGSTGVPKGVTIGHESLLNAILFSNKRLGLKQEDAVFGITALHHDLSVYDIFGALTAGAKLVLPSKDIYLPEEWIRLVRKEEVTFWNSVPMFMEQLLAHCIEQNQSVPLKTVLLGGDWVDPGIVERLALAAPQATLYTTGGPTETTLWNIINRVERRPAGWDSLPYGRPIPNASYHILTEELRDAPDWVRGEMYCGGRTLCLSASLNPEENTKAFAVHPQTGERLYRTGDMGRYRPGGLIEIMGRKDFQLNINGYRLDPCEVEQTLAKHPDVQRVVVVAAAASGGRKDAKSVLTGFIVPTPGGDLSSLERRLREWSNAHLPAPMRPRRWIFIDALPLTVNGKVDRKALDTAAENNAPGMEDSQRPARNAVEEFLIEVWQEMLHTPVPGARSSFFELGGDSLQAMRVFSRIEKKLGISLSLSLIFTAPTVESLSEAIYAEIARVAESRPLTLPASQNTASVTENA